jgi:hypothetical protein
MAPFRRSRRRDVNLEVAIGTEPGTADFYVFVEDEQSSLDKAWAEEKVASGHALRKTVLQQVERLADVPPGTMSPATSTC